MAQVESLLSLTRTLPELAGVEDIVDGLNALDDHLAIRTFFVGHVISHVDWIIWGQIRGVFSLRQVLIA